MEEIQLHMNDITSDLLKVVSEIPGEPDIDFNNVAFNIREDSGCAGRRSTKNIKITPKTDKSGIDIRVAPGTKSEKVYIPACVTKSGVQDLAYNDFYIGANADVTIVAGCGIHTDGHGDSQHNGIHRFFVEQGARVVYLEKHIGEGTSDEKKVINPVTEIFAEKDSYVEMDTTQIGGVDHTERVTRGTLAEGAKLIVREKIMTEADQYALTNFEIELAGEGAGVDLISRSVAKGNSHQIFHSKMNGNAPCTGHSECDAIIMDDAKVEAMPALIAGNVDASLIHEAAIGKIAGEQLIKLMTLGLTEEEAVQKIIEGFLK